MKYLSTLLILCSLFISNTAIAQTKGDIQLQGQLDLMSESFVHYVSSTPISSIALEAPIQLPGARILSIRDKVSIAFWDEPRMMDIVECESSFRQFKDNGKPLISGTSDVGVMQINRVHWKEAKNLGLDIFYSDEDNIKMGRIIYEQQGLKGWTCNKKV